jgi:hypothetical protein
MVLSQMAAMQRVEQYPQKLLILKSRLKNIWQQNLSYFFKVFYSWIFISLFSLFFWSYFSTKQEEEYIKESLKE